MKYLFITFISFCICSAIYGQDSLSKGYRILELKEFYNTTGVVFPGNYRSYASIKYNMKTYTPSDTDIINGEKILSNLIHMFLGNAKRYKIAADAYLRRYYRQYAGLVNTKGEKILLLVMLDFSDEGKNLLYKNYYREIRTLDAKGSNYYRHFLINLNTKELEYQSDGVMDEYWIGIDRNYYSY